MATLLKQDINFLEYPLYLLHKRVLKQDINMKFGDKHFQMSVGYKTPNTIDMLFLYYFLKELEIKNYSKKIILTPDPSTGNTINLNKLP